MHLESKWLVPNRCHDWFFRLKNLEISDIWKQISNTLRYWTMRSLYVVLLLFSYERAMILCFSVSPLYSAWIQTKNRTVCQGNSWRTTRYHKHCESSIKKMPLYPIKVPWSQVESYLLNELIQHVTATEIFQPNKLGEFNYGVADNEKSLNTTIYPNGAATLKTKSDGTRTCFIISDIMSCLLFLKFSNIISRDICQSRQRRPQSTGRK